MFLNDIDVFSSCIEERESKDSRAESLRAAYAPKLCSSSADLVGTDANAQKARADLLFMEGMYQDALAGYLALISRKDMKSASVRRDLTESLARTHLALGYLNYSYFF